MSAEQTGTAAERGLVTFVNRFSLQVSPEEFERVFAQASDFMTRQPGFIQNTLLRHLDRSDKYINIAQWDGAESLRAAVGCPDFGPHAAALRALSSSEPNLYLLRHKFARSLA